MTKHNKNFIPPSILDFEASGFGSESYPIEVGVITSVGERYCTLIKPEARWLHWCTEAARVHGIARRELLQFGIPVRQVCEDLNRVLGDTKVYSDCWSHDKGWLNRLYQASGLIPCFRLSPIEAIASEEQLMLWDRIKRRVERDLGLERHRASSDALIIQQTYVDSHRAALTMQSYNLPRGQQAQRGTGI